MINQPKDEMSIKIEEVTSPVVLKNINIYYDEQQELSDADADTDDCGSLPPLLEVNDCDITRDDINKHFEDVSDRLLYIQSDMDFYAMQTLKSEKKISETSEQVDKLNKKLQKKQEKQKRKIKKLRQHHFYQKERIAELEDKIAGMPSKRKYKEQKSRIKDLEKQIENVRETVHQLLGGLFNQNTQLDVLEQHVDRLFGRRTIYVENIVDTIPNMWDIWPTTRQGDFNEERIEKLESLLNNKETETKATSTEEVEVKEAAAEAGAEAAELLSLKELL